MQQTGKCTLVYWCGSTIASPGGKLSSVARLMRNGDTNRFRIRFVKKVLLETLYVLIYRCPISESVAVPHPPLRGTFPPGEGISPTNFQFSVLPRKLLISTFLAQVLSKRPLFVFILQGVFQFILNQSSTFVENSSLRHCPAGNDPPNRTTPDRPGAKRQHIPTARLGRPP